MKNKCTIIINNELLEVIIKNFIKFNINYEIINESKKIFKIDINDISRVREIFNDIKILKISGINKIKLIIKSKYIMIFSMLLSLLIVFLLSNMVLFVNIETNNKEVKKMISDSLEEYGIKKYSFKKSYKKLNYIKKNILNDNKNTIDWIEIEELGTRYNVKLVLKKENIKKRNNEPRSIIAKKDGVIKKIICSSGNVLKEKNDYVKKGEVIISGNIIKGENEVKSIVRSNGVVYAEVWYKTNITIPYNLVKYKKTDNTFNNYYIKFGNKKMNLINYYNFKNNRINKSEEINKIYFPFKIIKENVTEYKYVKYKLNSNDAYSLAIKTSDKKLKSTLKKDEYIISKKVLKKEVFSSKISIEVFYKVYENITSYSEVEKIKKEEG